MQTLEIVFDVLFICVMLPALCYVFILSHRLQKFRRLQEQMYQSREEFQESLRQAHKLLSHVLSESDKVSSMQKNIEETRVLQDDLRIMISSGERTARKLEQALSMTRDVDKKLARKNRSSGGSGRSAA